jgi:hypothetical protein
VNANHTIHARFSVATGIEDASHIPMRFHLYQNYPNPFNPLTVIQYSIPKKGFVSLKVYNTLGEEIANLNNRIMAAGDHKVVFDGNGLPSGVYLIRLQYDEMVQLKKIMLSK